MLAVYSINYIILLYVQAIYIYNSVFLWMEYIFAKQIMFIMVIPSTVLPTSIKLRLTPIICEYFLNTLFAPIAISVHTSACHLGDTGLSQFASI